MIKMSPRLQGENIIFSRNNIKEGRRDGEEGERERENKVLFLRDIFT